MRERIQVEGSGVVEVVPAKPPRKSGISSSRSPIPRNNVALVTKKSKKDVLSEESTVIELNPKVKVRVLKEQSDLPRWLGHFKKRKDSKIPATAINNQDTNSCESVDFSCVAQYPKFKELEDKIKSVRTETSSLDRAVSLSGAKTKAFYRSCPALPTYENQIGKYVGKNADKSSDSVCNENVEVACARASPVLRVQRTYASETGTTPESCTAQRYAAWTNIVRNLKSPPATNNVSSLKFPPQELSFKETPSKRVTLVMNTEEIGRTQSEKSCANAIYNSSSSLTATTDSSSSTTSLLGTTSEAFNDHSNFGNTSVVQKSLTGQIGKLLYDGCCSSSLAETALLEDDENSTLFQQEEEESLTVMQTLDSATWIRKDDTFSTSTTDSSASTQNPSDIAIFLWPWLKPTSTCGTAKTASSF